MLPHQFFKLLAELKRAAAPPTDDCSGKRRFVWLRLAEALNESQPKISRHLALLRASGVVVDIRQGAVGVLSYFRSTAGMDAQADPRVGGVQLS